MLGPQYERLSEIQKKLTGKQIFQRIKNNSDNPLSRIVSKLKRQFNQYETHYDNPIMDYQISALDRILSFDNKLGPILDALEKENQLLRKELANLENHLSQSVGICENILNENNELKVIIKKKNEDISKIIETVAANQAEEVDEFQQKNRLLMQENSILLRHLEEIKKQHDRYNDALKEKDGERLLSQKKFQENKKQLSESISRQRELFRKISLLEQNIYQNTEEIYSLQQTKQNLTFQNNQLKNQLLLFKGKTESIGNQALKRQIESEYGPIIEQHKLLKKERAQILRQSEKLKLQNQKLEDYISELQRNCNKLSGDLQLTQSLLIEKKQELGRVTQTHNRLESKLNDTKEQNNRIRAEKETNSVFIVNKEKRLVEQIERLRVALDDKSRQIQHRMKEIKESMHGLIESKELQIRNLRQENIQLQRIIDRR